MAKSTKTDSESKNALIKLVKSLLPGKHNTIPLSLPVAQALGGDLESAIIFSQCMYWSERTDDPDGYFYKCYDEWYEETTIKERTCRDRIKKLEARGWIHTLIMHVHNVPKLHIKVLPENFIEDLIESQDEIARETEERAEKKAIDLRTRREKRKESSNPCAPSIRQNLPDNSGKSCRITAAEVAGSIDTKITTRDYIPEITSKYAKSVSKESADSGSTNNEGLANDELEGKQGGMASPRDQKQDSGSRENDYHSQNPYFIPWDTSTAFREDEDGWAVIPQFPKHKMANFIATRAMQLELLAEVDDALEIEWDSNNGRQCWIVTKSEAGFEDDVLGTRKSTGMEKGDYAIEYDDGELCCPGQASLRLLRNVAIEQGFMSQETYNCRLKELWDDARVFLEKDNSMVIFSTCPIYEYMNLEGIQMENKVEVLPSI
jgi:hypothetical protein